MKPLKIVVWWVILMLTGIVMVFTGSWIGGIACWDSPLNTMARTATIIGGVLTITVFCVGFAITIVVTVLMIFGVKPPD